MVLKRIFTFIVNIIFPPLAVLMICGCGRDFALNCLFTLCALIPGHIHAFYISCTYFHRKNKVKKGKYPGGSKKLIYARKVINGGASDGLVEALRIKQTGVVGMV